MQDNGASAETGFDNEYAALPPADLCEPQSLDPSRLSRAPYESELPSRH